MIDAGLVDEVRSVWARASVPICRRSAVSATREIGAFLRGELRSTPPSRRWRAPPASSRKRQLHLVRHVPEVRWCEAQASIADVIATAGT